jgi:hypothetical protein
VTDSFLFITDDINKECSSVSNGPSDLGGQAAELKESQHLEHHAESPDKDVVHDTDASDNKEDHTENYVSKDRHMHPGRFSMSIHC